MRKNAKELQYEALVAIGNEDTAKSLKYFNAISPNDTGYSMANFYSYFLYKQMGNFEKCLELSNIGLENNKKDESDFYIQKGNSLLSLERYQDALDVYEKALEKYPFNHVLHYNRAKAYQSLENYDAYLASLKKTVSIYPYYAPAHRELGFAAENSGKVTQALMSFVMSILVEPNSDRSNSILAHIDELVTDKFKQDEEAHSFEFEGDDYSEIDLLIRNYVALQKGYKSKSKAKLKLVKQLQLMMERLEFNSKDGGYWMNTYVRFYTKLWDEDLFEHFSYYILKASNNYKHQKLVRKKGKKIEKFSNWAGDEINDYFNTLPIDIEGKKFVGNRRYGAHGEKGLSSISSFKNESIEGPIYYIHASGALKGRGKLNANGEGYGNWTWYTERGELFKEYSLKKGVLQGVYKIYFSNGHLSEEISFKDDFRDGVYKSYFINGGISSKQYYKKGVEDGPVFFYHKNGEVSYKFEKVQNKIEGTVKQFFPNGQLRYIQSFTDNERDSIATSYYADGKLLSKFQYKEGVLEGPYEEYFFNGNLERKGTYQKGSQSGENVDYWLNGKLFQKNIYDADGKKNGLSQEFDKDGAKYLEFDYKKGNIIAYRIFDKTGKIVKSGKKKRGDFQYDGLYADGTIRSSGLYDSKGGKEGVWKFYDKNGKLESEGYYEDGQLEGAYASYFPNGKVSYESNYEEGSWNGIATNYFIDGKIRSVLVGENGNAERQKVSLNRFGDTVSVEYYYQGDAEGWQYYYNPNGKLDYKIFDVSGTAVSEIYYDTNEVAFDTLSFFGTKTLESSYPNGQKKFSISYVNGQVNGPAVWYFGNGKVWKKGQFKDGDEVGDWVNYFANGKVYLEYSYKNGIREGITKKYHKSGKIAEIYTYLNGSLNGADTYYYEDGKVSNIYNYYMGSMNGVAKFHSPEGKLDHVRYYNYGKIIGYSYEGKDGKLIEMIPLENETAEVKSYFSNGKLGREYVLIAGEFDKDYIEYYSNGQVAEKSTYNFGSREGEYVEYYKNGNLKESGTYKNDSKSGSYKEYYSNKQLKSEKNYVKGFLHGESKYYSKSGKLIMTQIFYYGDIVSETGSTP